MARSRLKDWYLVAVSERRGGILLRLFRLFLLPAAFLYRMAIALRAFCYRTGLLHTHRFPCPVISVGNITAGGTGKSPMVEWLVRRLRGHDLKVLVLTRGYGKTGARDDEDFAGDAPGGGPRDNGLLRLAGKNRVAIARKAMNDFRPDVIVLDDSFQHRRIARDLEIVMIDALRPFANGHLLPRGLLREPPSALKRADLIVLSRTDQVLPSRLEQIKEEVNALSGGRTTVESVHHVVNVRSCWNRKLHPPEWLKHRRVYAFCGIGNPDSLVKTLESIGANVVRSRFYPDHHRYTPLEVNQLTAEAKEFMADAMVTTEKDGRRLNADDFELTLAVVKVDLEIVKGEEHVDEILTRLIHDRRKPVGTKSHE